MPKESLLFKGVKYFYTAEKEKELFGKAEMSYFGNELTAYSYAKRYSGGIQVYKAVRDVKLFNVTNDNNLKHILGLASKEDPQKIFFEDVTY